MKRFVVSVLLWLLVLEPNMFAGLGGDKTAYMGGTENQIKEGMEGYSSSKDEKAFVFEYKGASADVADKCVKQLLRDVGKLEQSTDSSLVAAPSAQQAH